ncbi:DNA replication complex subunit Gins51 [Halomarina litorea]|uniref:DNA replication complex subunit Gins51 n=1 Tax=Halomarina litorea TaxID=2961595 RepID=UPI0020C59DAC|nr:hypothetical protein [Halomarina sp. BCD28]
MNLDELQSVQSRERQTDSLQQLRESFYEEAGRFIAQLREERERAAEAAEDPFDAPEVRRLTDDIKTAERTVEAIYERRIGKLVKQASLDAAGMAADASGLTTEELDVFERLVDTIEANRAHVLDEVVAGDPTESTDRSSEGTATEADDTSPVDSVEGDPSRKAGRPPETPSDASDVGADAGADPSDEPTTESVSAADVMGGDVPSDPTGSEEGTDPSPAEVPPDAGADPTGQAARDSESRQVPPDTPSETDAARAPTAAPETPDDGRTPDVEGDSDEPDQRDAVERTTVRITQDVGEILGIDERSYTLASEDVVTLPSANAEPLLQRNAAERLD